jgi:hypothetical protein
MKNQSPFLRNYQSQTGFYAEALQKSKLMSDTRVNTINQKSEKNNLNFTEASQELSPKVK